jgi:uncharacterized membrane protein YoaK (UPF0700 family)
MFRHEGSERTERENRLLAACLASVAGYVNASGLVLLGVFTSHTTGNVARVVQEVASAELHASGTALLLVVSFFSGAFLASLVIEGNDSARASRTYGGLLLVEALHFLVFLAVDRWFPSTHPRALDAKASILCAAMGLQNSLVTRLSGAVVRTTHLTGIVTDLAIEAARWFRFARGRLSGTLHVRLAFGDRPIARPQPGKVRLLSIILGAFCVGGVAGAVATRSLHQLALFVPIAVTCVGGVYGIVTDRRLIVARE